MTDKVQLDPKNHFIRSRLQEARLVLRALRVGLKTRPAFDEVETYAMFVGHPRSGHTLVKALLNAHDQIVIGQEANILKYVSLGFNRWMLYSMILASDQYFHGAGRTWDQYGYQIPNQWQGKYRQLRLIGDKKAGRSTYLIGKNPDLLNRLQRTVNVPIKLFFVVRNPFDNIATISRKHGYSLSESIDLYLRLCRNVVDLHAAYPDIPMITVYLEKLIENPQDELQRMLEFVGLKSDAAYLSDCARIVFSSPNLSRNQVDWPTDLIKRVEAGVQDFDFLQGYSFLI